MNKMYLSNGFMITDAPSSFSSSNFSPIQLNSDCKIEDSMVLGSRLCSVILSNASREMKIELVKKLVQQGVDINFQDLNRNGNTPLQCSVEKEDSTMVKFLLYETTLKINPLLRNNDGLTALDVAKRRNDEEVIRLLKPYYSSGESIQGIYISRCTLATAVENIANRSCDPLFKVLKISTRASWEDVCQLLKEDFSSEFNKSSHWFVTLFSILRRGNFDAININSMNALSSNFSTKKPCVISFKGNEVLKVFYKDVGWKHFKLVAPNQIVGSLTGIIENGGLTFELLIQNMLNKFNDLNASSLNPKKVYGNKRLIDHAASTGSALLIRFLMLFQFDLKHSCEGQKRALEIASEYGTEDAVRALLNLPFNLNTNVNDILSLSKESKELAELPDANGQTPIFIACEFGSEAVLTCFLQCQLKTKTKSKKKDIELSDIAWKNKRYSHLQLLINAEKCFPIAKKSELIAISNLKDIINERDDFHKNIAEDNLKCVKEFTNGRRLKFGYNWSNVSALKTAFREESFEVYAFLLSKGFKLGEHEKETVNTYEEKIHKSNDKHAKYLKASRKYFKRANHYHIYHLISNSTEKNFFGNFSEKILFYYQKLDEIPEMSLVMKVVQHLKVDITFDMKSDNIAKIYDTKHQELDETYGLHVISSNQILIGAKRSENEVLGTLAHELTHMAIQICFDNECKPYDKHSKNEAVFNEIVAEYKNLRNANPIIQRVFSKFYEERSECTAELIVRVNHLLADDVKKRRVYEVEYKKLFDFYNIHVSKRFQKFVDRPQFALTRHKIRRLNDNFLNLGILKAEEDSIKKNASKSFDFLEKDLCNLVIIGSFNPHLTLLKLYHYLKNKTEDFAELSGSYLFAKVSNLKSKNDQNDIVQMSQNDATKYLLIEPDVLLSIDKWLSFFKSISKSKIKTKIIVVCESSDSLIKMSSKIESETRFRVNVHSIIFRDSWKDFSDKKAEELLRKDVNYQGVRTTLKEILPGSLKERNILLEELNIRLLDSLSIDVQKLPFDEYDECGFIDRTIIQDSIKLNTTNIKKIFEKGRQEKIMLISDDAGMGKSIILTHLARNFKKQFPNYWVVRKNLNADIIHDFNKNLTVNHDNNCIFLLEFLSIETNFEKKLFQSLYQEQRLLIFLDGVNETKLDDKVTLNAVHKLASTLKYCQLWLTTRNTMKTELEKILNTTSIKLKKFSASDQILFVQNFWLKHTTDTEITSELQISTNALISKLLLSIDADVINIIGIPLQTRMIAEIFCKKVKETIRSKNAIDQLFSKTFDLNELYKQFIHAKISIWLSRSQYSITTETADFMKHGWKMHQMLSIQSHFSLSLIKRLFTDNELTLVPKLRKILGEIGILHYKRTPKFAHQTYAEYFIADYVIDEIFNCSDWNSHKIDFVRDVFTDSKCVLIRQFINSFMKNFKIPKKNNGTSSFVENVLSFVKERIIHKLVEENLADIVSFFLQYLQKRYQKQLPLFFHIAIASKSYESFEVLLKYIQDPQEVISLLCSDAILNTAIVCHYSIAELEKVLNMLRKWKVILKSIFSRDKHIFQSTLRSAQNEGYSSKELKELEDLMRQTGGERIRHKRKANS